MKKITLAILLIILTLPPISALAAPYDTLVPSANSNYSIINPLYEVGADVPYNFEQPSDLFVDKEDTLYVADTTKVVKFKTDGTGQVIGEGIIEQATGIFVSDKLELYIADQSLQTVLVFNKDGSYNRQYDRPKELYFGEETPYAPIDVAVTTTEKIYIASSGTTDGLISIDQSGKFLGFFGANESRKSIFSSKQLNSSRLASIFSPKPASIDKVTVDNKGLIYTLTPGVDSYIRKLNFAATNLLDDDKNQTKSDALIDVWVDKYGNIYTLNGGENNNVAVFTTQGELIFSFGDFSQSGSTSQGMFITPTAIAVDSNQAIYAIDGGKRTVQTYIPTEFGINLYESTNNYNNGKYEDSVEFYNEMMLFANTYPMAYDNNGMAAYKNGEYSKALNYFEISGNSEKYSNSYYFIRDNWISENVSYIVIAVLCLLITRFIMKRNRILEKLRNKYSLYNKMAQHKEDILQVMKKPDYTFYLVKYKDLLNGKIATALYIVALVVIILYVQFTDYLFNPIPTNLKISVTTIIFLFITTNAIYQLCNYLVSRIMYGEGSLRGMYIANSLVYVPIILILPITIIMSYVLTLNEGSLYMGLILVALVWSLVIMFRSISEMHNFFPHKVIFNIGATLFTIVVVITVFATCTYMVGEIYNTIRAIILEVLR